jgi:hypothetical protein
VKNKEFPQAFIYSQGTATLGMLNNITNTLEILAPKSNYNDRLIKVSIRSIIAIE